MPRPGHSAHRPRTNPTPRHVTNRASRPQNRTRFLQTANLCYRKHRPDAGDDDGRPQGGEIQNQAAKKRVTLRTGSKRCIMAVSNLEERTTQLQKLVGKYEALLEKGGRPESGQ